MKKSKYIVIKIFILFFAIGIVMGVIMGTKLFL